MVENLNEQTLVDFLKLKEFDIIDDTMFKDVVEYALTHQYSGVGGILYFTEDGLKRGMQFGLLVNKEFNSCFLSTIPKSERTPERLRHIAQTIEERIQNANLEELLQASMEITCKVEQNAPKTFYEAAIKVYYNMMKEVEKLSKSMHFFSTKVRPLVVSNSGYLSLQDITRILGREEVFDSLNELSAQQHLRILKNKGITTQDIDELMSSFQNFDRNRDVLHKKILSYAKRHFQKDYLDVFVDILSLEQLPTEKYNHLYSPRKGLLIFDVGLIDIRSHGKEFREFVRAYGEEYSDGRRKYIEDGYKALREARQGENLVLWGQPNYKSQIRAGRLEEEDDRLLDQINSKFGQSVAFRGDYLLQDYHGHYLFSKIIMFDVDKIKREEQNPENKLVEIKNYIASLLPSKIEKL